jgi:hypothetical protein
MKYFYKCHLLLKYFTKDYNIKQILKNVLLNNF